MLNKRAKTDSDQLTIGIVFKFGFESISWSSDPYFRKNRHNNIIWCTGRYAVRTKYQFPNTYPLLYVRLHTKQLPPILYVPYVNRRCLPGRWERHWLWHCRASWGTKRADSRATGDSSDSAYPKCTADRHCLAPPRTLYSFPPTTPLSKLGFAYSSVCGACMISKGLITFCFIFQIMVYMQSCL